MVEHYSRDVRIYVNEITSPVLGREILRRCGNEGQHPYLDGTGRATLKFLRAAISFIPDAMYDGADLRNTAFIFAQPGREFLIKAGNGDWEFYFSEDEYGDIWGRCVRQPLRRYLWDGVKSVVRCIGSAIGRYLPIFGSTTQALTAA